MDVVIQFFVDLWALLSGVALDALLPALLVSLIVGGLKWRGLVNTPDQIRGVVGTLSVVSGGFLTAGGIEDAVFMGMVGLFASLFHALAEIVGDPLKAKFAPSP